MDSTYLTYGIIALLILIIIAVKISSGSEKRKVFKDNKYLYTAKKLIMSNY